MSVPLKHILQQGANLKTLGNVGLAALRSPPEGPPPELPGPLLEAELPPRPAQLVEDFIRWTGGEPRAWEGCLPPTLFPQWGFPLLGPALKGLPYPLSKVLNQGCRLTVNAPLPADAPLRVSVQLVAIEAQPHKARIHQRLVTGTAEVPEALVADVFAHVPLDGPRPEGSARRGAPTVPHEARKLQRLELTTSAGWDFALLTGDLNPIHWLGPYAKLAGFKRVILHGFASLACSLQAVVQHRWSGDPFRLQQLDVRFTRPLVLPARPAVYLGTEPGSDGARALALGEELGGKAYMLGSIRTREPAPAPAALPPELDPTDGPQESSP